MGGLCRFSYRKDESVLEVRELFVALLAAEHAVLLIHHFLVAVLAGTRLVEAVLFAQEHYGGDAGEVISLKQSTNKKKKYPLSHFFSPVINTCFHVQPVKHDNFTKPTNNKTASN